MPKKRRKLNKDFEKKIYSSKKNVELVLAKIHDIDDEDIQKEYISGLNEVVYLFDELKIDTSTKRDENSSVIPTNPFELVEMIRRQNSMNDATNPSDAIDDALKSFSGLEEKQEI